MMNTPRYNLHTFCFGESSVQNSPELAIFGFDSNQKYFVSHHKSR
jgi:hypothetical protein